MHASSCQTYSESDSVPCSVAHPVGYATPRIAKTPPLPGSAAQAAMMGMLPHRTTPSNAPNIGGRANVVRHAQRQANLDDSFGAINRASSVPALLRREPSNLMLEPVTGEASQLAAPIMPFHQAVIAVASPYTANGTVSVAAGRSSHLFSNHAGGASTADTMKHTAQHLDPRVDGFEQTVRM